MKDGRLLEIGAIKEEAAAEEKKPTFSLFNPENKITRAAVITVMIVATVIFATWAMADFLGMKAWGLTSLRWYWIAMLAIGTILLGKWIQKSVSVEPIIKIARVIISLVIVMLGAQTIWPNATLKSWSRSEAPTTPAVTTKWPAREIVTLGIGEHRFTLSPGETTPWLQIPGDTVYDVYLPNNEGLFSIYYEDGTVVNFFRGENKELPRKTLATFKIVSREKDIQHFTITVKERKVM